MSTLSTAIGVFFGIFAEFFGSSANIQIKYSHKLEDLKAHNDQIPLFRRSRFQIACVLYIANGFFNLISCIFASLNVLAPTSSFTIVLNAILAHIYFSEKLQCCGYFASGFIMIGSTISVIYGHNESKTSFDLQELTALVTESGSVFFAIAHWSVITFCILCGKAMNRQFIRDTSVIFDDNNISSINRSPANPNDNMSILSRMRSFTSLYIKNSDTQYAIRAFCYAFGVGSIASWVQFFGKAVGVLIVESVGGDPQFDKFGSWLYMICASWFIYWMMVLISEMMKNFEAVLIVPLYETFIIFNMILLDAVYFGRAQTKTESSSDKIMFWLGIGICIVGMFVLCKYQKRSQNNDSDDNINDSDHDEIVPLKFKSDDHDDDIDIDIDINMDNDNKFVINNNNNNDDIMDQEDCPLITSNQNRRYSNYSSIDNNKINDNTIGT